MAHELTTNAAGKVEMAFTGSRSKIWHGLGQELDENASIDTWKVQAGMNWEALASKVQYNALGETMTDDTRKVLFRSDDKKVLGVVGAEYNVVQPGQVLEFFDDLTRIHGMKLSTAGTLFGGKRFWALAETGSKGEVVNGDEVGAYLLLTTSVDGTMSTQARFTSIRVVCNNTLTVALSGKAKKAVKVTHHTEWDAKQTKIDLGLLGESWGSYMDKLRHLSTIKMDEAATRKFYQDMFFDPKKGAEDQGLGATRAVDDLMERAFNGIGNELSRGTAWGALNGATELFTHWKGNKDASRQFWDGFAGEHAAKKELVLDGLMTAYA